MLAVVDYDVKGGLLLVGFLRYVFRYNSNNRVFAQTLHAVIKANLSANIPGPLFALKKVEVILSFGCAIRIGLLSLSGLLHRLVRGLSFLLAGYFHFEEGPISSSATLTSAPKRLGRVRRGYILIVRGDGLADQTQLLGQLLH
jgi:hypothetical protein